MKRIKLSTHRNAQSNSKKLGAYAVEQELNKKFKQLETMDCPSCYGTMSLIDGVWQCHNCSYCISQADMLDGATFWFCDGCGEFLNVQPGFTLESGKWVCTRCHWMNNVTEENILD